jgi:hypothetical protein
MKPACINLHETFGVHYRIDHDPSAVTWSEKADCWMQTILCWRGVTIYPFGGHLLAVEVDHHPGLLRQLLAISGVALRQDGDHEKTLTFHVDLFDQVADVVHPIRRRNLSAEQKAACVASLAAWRSAHSERQRQIATSETPIRLEIDEKATAAK